MGIDLFAFNFLMQFKSPELGDALCLGRQGFHIHPDDWQWEQAQRTLASVEPGLPLRSLVARTGYAETFFGYLGARSVSSLDMSPFEGADIIHDLNSPIPPELNNRFDFIFDGGTLEHVFNFPNAVANVKSMLRPGGLFVGVNPANNQLGHGLYQFSPELFWRVYSLDAGFSIEKMQLVPQSGTAPPIDVADTPGTRQEIGTTQHSTYIMVAARRSRISPADVVADVYQSDYAANWTRHAATGTR